MAETSPINLGDIIRDECRDIKYQAPADNTVVKFEATEAVIAIQTFLIEEGYLDGRADGLFGNGTGTALNAFMRDMEDLQSAYGLSAGDTNGAYDADMKDFLVQMEAANRIAAGRGETPPYDPDKLQGLIDGLNSLDVVAASVGRKHDTYLDILYNPDKYSAEEVEDCRNHPADALTSVPSDPAAPEPVEPAAPVEDPAVSETVTPDPTETTAPDPVEGTGTIGEPVPSLTEPDPVGPAEVVAEPVEPDPTETNASDPAATAEPDPVEPVVAAPDIVKPDPAAISPVPTAPAPDPADVDNIEPANILPPDAKTFYDWVCGVMAGSDEGQDEVRNIYRGLSSPDIDSGDFRSFLRSATPDQLAKVFMPAGDKGSHHDAAKAMLIIASKDGDLDDVAAAIKGAYAQIDGADFADVLKSSNHWTFRGCLAVIPGNADSTAFNAVVSSWVVIYSETGLSLADAIKSDLGCLVDLEKRGLGDNIPALLEAAGLTAAEIESLLEDYLPGNKSDAGDSLAARIQEIIAAESPAEPAATVDMPRSTEPVEPFEFRIYDWSGGPEGVGLFFDAWHNGTEEQALQHIEQNGLVTSSLGVREGIREVIEEYINRGLTLEDIKQSLEYGIQQGQDQVGTDDFYTTSRTPTYKDIGGTVDEVQIRLNQIALEELEKIESELAAGISAPIGAPVESLTDPSLTPAATGTGEAVDYGITVTGDGHLTYDESTKIAFGKSITENPENYRQQVEDAIRVYLDPEGKGLETIDPAVIINLRQTVEADWKAPSDFPSKAMNRHGLLVIDAIARDLEAAAEATRSAEAATTYVLNSPDLAGPYEFSSEVWRSLMTGDYKPFLDAAADSDTEAIRAMIAFAKSGPDDSLTVAGLLKAGAEADSDYLPHMTALMLADGPEVVQTLLSAGHEAGGSILVAEMLTAKDSLGRNALMWASDIEDNPEKSTEIIQAILDAAGGNKLTLANMIAAQDVNKWNALGIARNRGNAGVIDLLEKAASEAGILEEVITASGEGSWPIDVEVLASIDEALTPTGAREAIVGNAGAESSAEPADGEAAHDTGGDWSLIGSANAATPDAADAISEIAAAEEPVHDDAGIDSSTTTEAEGDGYTIIAHSNGFVSYRGSEDAYYADENSEAVIQAALMKQLDPDGDGIIDQEQLTAMREAHNGIAATGNADHKEFYVEGVDGENLDAQTLLILNTNAYMQIGNLKYGNDLTSDATDPAASSNTDVASSVHGRFGPELNDPFTTAHGKPDQEEIEIADIDPKLIPQGPNKIA